MSRLAAKLAFVHRALWRRDPAYRWAVLLGPPPLLGCALAAAAWAVISLAPTPPTETVPWAQWTRPVPQDDQPFTEGPAAPVPRTDADGKLVGFQPGWTGAIQPLTVDSTMDANVSSAVLTRFTLDQSAISLSKVLEAGGAEGLYVGTARTFLVVRTAGLYGLSARLTRSGTQQANCMVRLGSSKHRILRNVNLDVPGTGVLTFPPTQFQLEPGLYALAVATGCWRNNQVSGAGELTVLVRHPGSTRLEPASADELVRPVSRP